MGERALPAADWYIAASFAISVLPQLWRGKFVGHSFPAPLPEGANRVHYDELYVANWSLGLDLSILFHTVGQAVSPPRSAY